MLGAVGVEKDGVTFLKGGGGLLIISLIELTHSVF